MFEQLTERFRAWRGRTIEREAARSHVVRAARALAEKIAKSEGVWVAKSEEIGAEYRILVEALEHLDALEADK
jgi:hypothetical protein